VYEVIVEPPLYGDYQLITTEDGNIVVTTEEVRSEVTGERG